MSYKFLPVLAASAILVSPLSSLAQKTPRWVQVAETRDGDRLYVNAESIFKNPDGKLPSTQYVMQKIFGKPTPAGELRAFTKITAYCAVNMYRIDAHATYDDSNQIIKYVEYGTPSTPSYPVPELVPPNSVGESAHQYACSR